MPTSPTSSYKLRSSVKQETPFKRCDPEATLINVTHFSVCTKASIAQHSHKKLIICHLENEQIISYTIYQPISITIHQLVSAPYATALQRFADCSCQHRSLVGLIGLGTTLPISDADKKLYKLFTTKVSNNPNLFQMQDTKHTDFESLLEDFDVKQLLSIRPCVNYISYLL